MKTIRIALESVPHELTAPVITQQLQMTKGEMILRKDWTSILIFQFGPDFKEYNFGYYNSPIRTKNDAFFKRVAGK